MQNACQVIIYKRPTIVMQVTSRENPFRLYDIGRLRAEEEDLEEEEEEDEEEEDEDEDSERMSDTDSDNDNVQDEDLDDCKCLVDSLFCLGA